MSDQFSEKPLPPGKKECPGCGEIIPVNATRCWLCLDTYDDKRKRKRRRKRNDSSRSIDGQNGAWNSDGAAWGIFCVISACIGFVLAFEAPGVLVCLGSPIGAAFIFAAGSSWQNAEKAKGLGAAGSAKLVNSTLILIAIAILGCAFCLAVMNVCTNLH